MTKNKQPWESQKKGYQEALSYIHARKQGLITSFKTPWPKVNDAGVNGFEWQSLTVIGGSTQISKIKSSDISVIVDFKDWVLEKKFYIPTVLIPFDILSWTDLSPRAIEIGVARE